MTRPRRIARIAPGLPDYRTQLDRRHIDRKAFQAGGTSVGLLDAMQPWQGFYALLGEASGTLVGLLFVAASVGSGVHTRDKHDALRVFLSPTVVHFSSILVACLTALTPIRDWSLGGLLIGGEGLSGLVYALVVWRSMIRQGLIAKIDLEDRVWYAILPALGYLVVGTAGVSLSSRIELGCGLLAAGLCLLLLIGIRNAWDMTIWTVMRRAE